MAEIDSLEIKLQSNIQAVTKDLEQLIGNITLTSKAISAFGNNKALEQLNREAKGVADGMKQAASASGAMKNVSSAASAAQKPMEQLRKSVDETAKDLYAKFENFTPVINFSQSEESLKKLSETYQDQMVKAQNELNRIMASSSASSQTKGMERYIIRIQEAKNGIKAINDYLDRMSNKPATGEPVIHGAADMEDEKRSLKSFEEEYRNFEAMFKAGGVETEGGTFLPTRSVEMGLEQLREMYPQAKSLIASYEDLFNRLAKMESGVKFGGALAEIPENLKIADNPQDAFQPLTEEANEFQKVLDSIKPIEFKGNFFEMERWVDGLNQRFVSLQSRIEKLNQFGVNPDTQRLHTLQYDLQTVSVTLDKYKNELDEARKAGQLDIKIPSIDSQINRVQGSFNKLQNTMRGAKVVIPTDSLKKVEAEIERVKKKYDQTVESINRKAQTVQFYGTSTDYKNKMIELEALRNKYQELINKQSQLSKIGDVGTFTDLRDGLSKLSAAGKEFGSVFSGVSKLFHTVSNRSRSIASAVGKAAKSMLLLSNSGKKADKSFSKALKTIIKYGLGIRSLFVLFNRLRAAITEGMRNLVQYSQKTNESLSMLKSSLNQTKNSLAAAFAPIINAIAPAVNYLIQLLIKAINIINQFFAALTGQNTWIRAKYVYEDVAKSVSSASKAAKGALQPFDALNNLTTQDSGGGDASPADMFETLPVEQKFKDLIDWLKDMWDNADFYDLGRKIGEELQHGLANIPWDKIKSTARKLGKSLATLINGFVEVEGLGKAIGYSLAQAINTAYEFLNAFVHNLHWDSIGRFIADTINGFFQNIDWPLIRDTLITGAKGLGDAINSFAEQLDWDSVAKTISESINALSDTIIMFFERVNWYELGQKVGYALEKAIEDIDFKRIGRAIADVIQAALDFVSGILSQLSFGEIKGALGDLVSGFFGNIDIPDNLEGIATALAGILGSVVALKGVMKTAKLAKAFSDIVDAGNKLKKLKIASVFSDVKGLFSAFSNSFNTFKNSFAISGDLFASFKNGISSLSSGLEAFRASLSPVAKGVIGLTTVFAEFKVVNNAFDDIVNGTGDVSSAIGKITVAAGAAATALSVVFGVPAGIIIAGATAAVAGLKSLNDHFNALEVEKTGQRIKESLTNPGGVSFDSIADQYADSFAEIRGQFTNIADQSSKVDMLDDSITNVYQDIDKIRTSMENGVMSVEDGTEKLKTLFEDLEQVTAEKFGAIEDTLYSAFGENGAYRDVMERAGVDTQEMLAKVSGLSVDAQDRLREINEMQLNLDPFSEEYQRLEEEKRGITGHLNELEEAYNKYATDISALTVDYSGLVDSEGRLNEEFDTTLSGLLESGKALQSSIRESSAGIVNEFTELANTARAMGDESGAAYWDSMAKTTQTSGLELESQVGETSKQITDKMQTDFIDAISEQIIQAQNDWNNLKTGEKLRLSIFEGIDSEDEYVKSRLYAFKTNTLDPMSQQIDESLSQLGIDGAGWAEDATNQIYSSLFSSETVFSEFGSHVNYDLVDNWKTILESTKEQVVPIATETGEYISQGVYDGVNNNLSLVEEAGKNLADSAINIARNTLGVHSPSTVFAEIGRDLGLGLQNGITQGSPNVVTQMQNLVTKLKNAFTNVPSAFTTVGKNIMNGLLNGINSVAGTIYNKAKEIANNVATSIKNALNIHSPSRVMFELGDYTMQGFQLGLEKLYNPILSSVEKFGSDLQFAAYSPVDKIGSYQLDYAGNAQYQPTQISNDGYAAARNFDNAETNALLRELISAVRESGNIEWDGSIIGEKMRDYDSQYYNRTGHGAFQH